MIGLIDSFIFNILLLITILGEFVLPWILKHFYIGYNSKTMECDLSRVNLSSKDIFFGFLNDT